jgi:hypothetical protein
VLNWLVPGLLFLVIGHIASHVSSDGAAGAADWSGSRPGSPVFGTLHSGPPIVVGACGAQGAEAVQLVFANYAGCAAPRGGGCCSGDWSTGSSWSDGYSS